MTDFIINKLTKNKNEDISKMRSACGKVAGIIGLICNVILFLMKIAIGTISGSVAITADAVNNLSDASSSIISLLGFKLAEKPADAHHPYGHGRYEYLSGLTVSVLIIVIGVEILKSSADKIINPQEVKMSAALVIVLLLSIAVKLWMMLFNKKLAVKIKSQTLEATAQDSRNDVISTSAVLASALISHFLSIETDGWIGLLVAIFILISGLGLIRDTIDPMLGTAPDADYVKEIRSKILSYQGVLGMHDLMIHDYGPGKRFASVHVEMAAEGDVIESHDVIDNIECDMLREKGLHLIVHYDPILTKDPMTNDIRLMVDETVKKIDSRLSIHDLRVVPGTTHTNLVFDCVADYDIKMSEVELKREISERVKEINPEYICVITIDRSYAPMVK